MLHIEYVTVKDLQIYFFLEYRERASQGLIQKILGEQFTLHFQKWRRRWNGVESRDREGGSCWVLELLTFLCRLDIPWKIVNTNLKY